MRAILLIMTACVVAGCSSYPNDCSSEDAKRSGAACVTSEDCCFDYEATSKDPTTALTCSRFGRACREARELKVGETCNNDLQCASRNCDSGYGFCTKTCASNSACETLTTCARDQWTVSGGWHCMPSCLSDDDCAVYREPPRALSCKPTKTKDGSTVGVCLP